MFKSILTCLFLAGIMACGDNAAESTDNQGTTGTSDTTDAGETTDSDTSDTSDTGDSGSADNPDDASESARILLETNLGSITIQLDAQNAPNTVANFLSYVDDGFYDGADGAGQTTFHRVISGFMIQGGGFNASGGQKSTRAPIAIESDNGLSNTRGTIAMARTNDPDSATSQFYINHANNGFLDYESSANPGYAVFGEVVDGIDTVDAIAAVSTGANDVPNEAITIESVTRVAE